MVTGDKYTDTELYQINRVEKLEAENKRLREALTPSGETKAAYIGEFHFYVSTFDEDIRVAVPWTSIKEIMAAIKARAELSVSGAEQND